MKSSQDDHTAMQSPAQKEENPTELNWNRYFKYLTEALKGSSLEIGRSMKTLATSLPVCCKSRLFCNCYLRIIES